MLQNFIFGLTNSVSGYSILSGARFNPSNNAKLTRSFGTPTDARKVTISCWAFLHQSTTNAFNSFLGVESPVDAFYSRYDLNNALEYRANNTSEAIVRTNALYRDVMPTHFLLSLDTTQATATDRVYIAVNGVQNTSFSTELDPSLNYASGIGAALTHVIGSLSGFYSDFTLYEHQVFDGKSIQNGDLTLDQFCEINNGNPEPVKPNFTAADYGNNGSYLKFDGDATDSSGNGNDWTESASGITYVTNTPTDVFCSLAPNDQRTTGTLSGGNLTVSGNAAVTLRPSSGEWYYEKDGVGVSYDADVSGQFDPVLTTGTYNFGATAWADTGPTGAEQTISVKNMTPDAITSGTSIVGFNWTGGTPSNISGPTVTAIYGTGFVASNAVAFTCDVPNPVGGTVMPRGQAN